MYSFITLAIGAGGSNIFVRVLYCSLRYRKGSINTDKGILDDLTLYPIYSKKLDFGYILFSIVKLRQNTIDRKSNARILRES